MPRLRIGPVRWLSLAAALLILGRLGVATRATEGCALGLGIGAVYVWLLLRRSAALGTLPSRQALTAARLAAVLRCCFVFAAFLVAQHAWPAAGLGWGAGTLLLPVAVSMLELARGA